MKRRVFTILSAVSLVLAVAVAGVWFRGLYRVDLVSIVTPFGIAQLGTRRGHIECYGGVSTSAWVLRWEAIDLGQLDPSENLFEEYPLHFLGFGYVSYPASPKSGSGAISGFQFIFPCWFAFLLALILPGLWFWKRRFKTSSTFRVCPSCGYDLRASKDKCPECGAAIPART